MNKKGFKWLILMMALSVLGIIGIQIIWIRNAVSVLNESFDHTAYECVRQAAEAIERARETDFVNNYAFQNIEPEENRYMGIFLHEFKQYPVICDNVSISSTTVAQRTGGAGDSIKRYHNLNGFRQYCYPFHGKPGTVSIESGGVGHQPGQINVTSTRVHRLAREKVKRF